MEAVAVVVRPAAAALDVPVAGLVSAAAAAGVVPYPVPAAEQPHCLDGSGQAPQLFAAAPAVMVLFEKMVVVRPWMRLTLMWIQLALRRCCCVAPDGIGQRPQLIVPQL